MDAIVEELREYKRWLTSETRRVERALSALSDEEDEDTRSTNEMLLDAFKSNRKPMTIQDAHLHLRKSGWTTDSKDPANVIRAALARMAANGELRRTSDKRGVYVLADDNEFEDVTPPESEHELKAANRAEIDWRPLTDDNPWDSGPQSRPNRFGTTGKESAQRFRPAAKKREEDEPPF
ncbi:hypothetical protein CBI38_34085 (plasmid) [Rhodococcus oxybenzonivorans]|uniref:Uncharacterized protein n=1 Tax=Rhodococcus oxybenzonivorans TaxID=1990687 RepID=A0A2S2C6B2_9NOCA|nr:hypothetical protein CBI38_34085 [Rhodococcus oxybenzonivorans]